MVLLDRSVRRYAARVPSRLAVLGLLCGLLSSSPRRAEAQESQRSSTSVEALDTASSSANAESEWGSGTYLHFYGISSFGRGLRFNNPYRLRSQLGDSAESVSASEPFWDLSLGALFGAPLGLQHGVGLGFTVALQGVRQEVLTPSYIMWLPLSARFGLRGRVGLPVVIEPDASVGAEAGLGMHWMATAMFGLTFDLIGSLYHGAATLDADRTTIPMLSAQVGLLFDYEVLP